MSKSLVISIATHAVLFVLLVYSDRLRLEILKKQREKRLASGAIAVELYKPTDTAMRKGKEKRDLPPPDVKVPPPPPDAPALKVTKLNKKEKKDLDKTKNQLKDILKQMKREAQAEDRPPPKLDNFPTSQQGEVASRGTGGRSNRVLSPAEQALQSAMRRHFELIDATSIRKKYPNAEGTIAISLVGVGQQFQIRSLEILESSGLTMLDQSCERAIRTAIDSETFSSDVVNELNGKEAELLCRP